jgi:ABC-type branched-subunit amino acid transport system permease subunit
VLGGLIIGVIQQISDNRIGTEWTPAIVFASSCSSWSCVPQGCSGEQTREAGMTAQAAARAERSRSRAAGLREPGARRHGHRPGDPAALRPGPDLRDPQRHDHRPGLRDHGPGPERGGRLRRPARPGYVAVLRDRAYSVGWFASSFYQDANIHVLVSGPLETLPGIHMNFLLVVVIAMILCAIAGIIIGLPTLRLRGDYIAIVTLAVRRDHLRLRRQRRQHQPVQRGLPAHAGRQGITPVDLVKIPVSSASPPRPAALVLAALALALLALFVNLRLRDSRLGRAWIAVREDEVAAVSHGHPDRAREALAYAIGAATAGSRAPSSDVLNTVNADQFEFSFSIFVLAMIILGGPRLHLGRGRRARSRCRSSTPADPRRAQRGARQDRARLRPHAARLRASSASCS